MNIRPLEINGAYICESKVFIDSRGSFREWFKLEPIKASTKVEFQVEQGNLSMSSKGTLRGLHYSLAPAGQAKWITCISGSILDVIVDIRPNSKTFKQFVTVNLNSDSGEAILVDKGLAHGFLALEELTCVAYLVSSQFSPSEEFEINPLDPELGINWNFNHNELKMSIKDSNAPSLRERFEAGLLPKLNEVLD